MLVGLLPLGPFACELLLGYRHLDPFLSSAAITAAAFFVVGAAKGRFVGQRWYWGGLETLAVGGAAALLAYVAAVALRGLATATA